MANRLLDESKDTFWPLGFPAYAEKLRIQETIASILEDARPQTVGKGEFVIGNSIKAVLIAQIISGHLRSAQGTIEKLIGAQGTLVTSLAWDGQERRRNGDGTRRGKEKP